MYPWVKDAVGIVSTVFGSPVSVTVDSTAPIVNSITRVNASTTNFTSVGFTVTFSEDISGIDMAGPPFDDLTLMISSSISGASITGVSGSGKTYTVTVNTGNGNGTIRLDVPDTATITDLVGNPLSGLPFEFGETYTIDKSAPLSSPWIGGIAVSSDKNIVAVGRPHIGSEIASYDGFSSGSLTAYVPMLFKNAYGGSYDSALYIQNVDSALATLSIKYYTSAGALACTVSRHHCSAGFQGLLAAGSRG